MQSDDVVEVACASLGTTFSNALHLVCTLLVAAATCVSLTLFAHWYHFTAVRPLPLPPLVDGSRSDAEDAFKHFANAARGEEKKTPLALFVEECRLPVAISNELNLLICHIVNEWIQPWFQEVSDDEAFSHDVRYLLAHVMGSLSLRVQASSLNVLTFILEDVVQLVTLYMRMFNAVRDDLTRVRRPAANR